METSLPHSHHASTAAALAAFAALAPATFAASFASVVSVVSAVSHTTSHVHAVPSPVPHTELQDSMDGARFESVNIIFDGALKATKTVVGLSRRQSDQHGQEEENETKLHLLFVLLNLDTVQGCLFTAKDDEL